MAKKEFIKLTPEGLNMNMILNYSNIADTSGFYGKEVFLSEGFAGDTQYLFQALGNIGAFARAKNLDIDVSYIIISNQLVERFSRENYVDFFANLEDKLNQNNSAYRRIKLLSEEHLIWYFENRIVTNKDEQLKDLIDKYKQSRKNKLQELF